MTNETGILCGAFATGVGSSLGPCAAPRYLIASACAAGSRAWAKTATFAAGTIGGYLIYALAGGALGAFRVGSHVIYASISIALLAGGLATLYRSREHVCRPVPAPRLGGMLALGVTSALTLSPCCTPVALALGLEASLGPNAALAAGALVAFGIGHAFPMLGVAGFGSLARRRWPGVELRSESSLVSGTILLGVGALYGVLA